MIERSIRYGFLALITALLLSCGGSGGGSDDDDGPTDPDPGGDPTSSIASLNVVANSNSLPSDAVSADDGVELTAIAKDENNNVVSDEEITFSATSGALQVTRSTTDSAGTASAILTTGGDPTNRSIEITASANNVQANVTVEVTGTRLSVTGPNAVPVNGSATYTITLSDAGGQGIANETVLISTQNGNATPSQTSPDTNSSGQVQVTLTGNSPGDETITAEALGLTASANLTVGGDNFQIITPDSGTQIPLNTGQDVTLRWESDGSPQTGEAIQFSTSRGSLSANTATTDGNGEATVTIQANNAGPATITASESGGLSTSLSVQFIATNPNSISVSANPATVGTESDSDIVAVVRDPNGNLVTGVTVNFTLDDTSGGSLRDASLQTDTQGRAQTVYTAGDTSASEPAEITATVAGTSISDIAEVTIGGEALRIALGTGNEILEPTTTTYIKPYVAVVTDANGNPVPDADFRLSVKPLSYQKGTRQFEDSDGDGTPDTWLTFYDVVSDGDPGEDSFGCFNEDLNDNNNLDAGEDVNNNGTLDPTNPVTVPGTVDLNENGTGEFDVTYPQNFALWLRVRVRATATVQGTESVEDAIFTLPILADDIDDGGESPPGEVSPFGTANECTNPD